jgi:hypothetical protein
VANWYHHYEITRPAYEAKYGLWVKLNIPAKIRVNGINSTLLYNGDVLIMAGSGNNQAFFNAGSFKTLLLNPVTMHAQLIPTPWDLFCAGHVELPNGNILIAGGTARYENLNPTNAAGSMTVVNNDTAQPWTLPKGTIFTAPDGAQFASASALTVPRATAGPVGYNGQPTVVPSQQNVWVDAVRKGRGSLIGKTERYQVQGLLGPQDNNLLYGLGTPMTLQKQDFLGTKDAYIFDVKTSRFAKVNSMNYARWYPTLAEMGNGMVMAMSAKCSALRPRPGPRARSAGSRPTRQRFSRRTGSCSSAGPVPGTGPPRRPGGRPDSGTSGRTSSARCPAYPIRRI